MLRSNPHFKDQFEHLRGTMHTKKQLGAQPKRSAANVAHSPSQSGYSSFAVFGYSVALAGFPIELDNGYPTAQKVERCFVPRSRICEYLQLLVDLSFRELTITSNVREVRNMQTVANIMTQPFYDSRLASLEQAFPQTWMSARNRYGSYVKVKVIDTSYAKEFLMRRSDLIQQIGNILSRADEHTMVKILTNIDMEY